MLLQAVGMAFDVRAMVDQAGRLEGKVLGDGGLVWNRNHKKNM